MRLRNVRGADEVIQNCPYVIKDIESYKGKYKTIFNNDNPIHIEIGMGKGNFIIGMAKQYPNINFIGIEKYDSVFGIKKLDGSNVHIYSVLFTFEMFKYIIKHLPNDIIDDFSIGVVCPYSPQAQLIESLIHQTPEIPSNIKITVGTVHRFQGGQCNLMFVVLNPPLGMKTASRRIFLNNKNILNVAISRAQDYLCILLPHRDTDGYENLYEINKIGNIALDDVENVTSYTSDQIEEILFGRK